MDSLNDLFEEQIKDLYSAENQLVKALPKMAKAASTPELKAAFEEHLVETQEQVTRLEKIAKELDFKPSGKMCHGMEGLLEEGEEATEEDGEEPIIDAAIIAAAQKVEHYEMSGYGTAKKLAELLGHDEIAKVLETTQEEEVAADEKLTQIAESAVYPQAQSSDDGEAAEDSESPKGKRTAGGRR